ncbi:MAG: pilus assembly protein TadG-related protein [Candidatus Limnocylindria bacterium]
MRQVIAAVARRARGYEARADRGQVLVLTAFCFVAIVSIAALVIDGGFSLGRRRNLQDAGDAAAIAAANVIKSSGTSRGCSDAAGPPPGAPRADVVQAALDSLAQNMPSLDPADVVVTCPDGRDNDAVRVELTQDARTFFASVIGADEVRVSTISTAINGQIFGTTYSVVLLDPGNPSWPNGRRGCPSFLLSGGPTVTFEGSLQVNSTCSEANGGALSTNGNASNLTVTGGAAIRLVGEYAPGSLTITPAPLEHQTVIQDPLAGLPPIDQATLPVRSNSKLTLNNATQVLEPGVYKGGIELRNSSVAYLRPGIYVLKGGGLDIGAQAKVFSIPASLSSTTDATWAADCPRTTCGVLLFNTVSVSGTMGQVSVAAGATLRLRSYYPDADAAFGYQYADYLNLLLWQDASPIPTNSYEQPPIRLNGGGSVTISGTVYAPSAAVEMGGGSGGAGGAVNVTLQFIAWDLSIQGNASFTFFYRDADFTKPTGYGLVE